MATTTHRRYDIVAIKRSVSLATLLVESGVRLKRAGPEKLKGCCPFHNDHHPSLLVDERDQHFHCFACGAHGDVIDFVMRRDGVPFAEACAHLAGRPASSVHVHVTGAKRPRTHKRCWERLGLDEQVVMNTAGALYQHLLWREPAALAYLRERGIPGWVIRACGLGYVDGHSLETFLRRRSGLRVAQELELLRKPERGDRTQPLREFFAGRIVVPEIRGGNFVWFIGRSLNDDPSRPKYLALSGERPVLGLERVAGRREGFLCEGVFDYLTAVSWKLPAFSTCGTHLPVDRLRFLARAEVIYGVLDADDAGRIAAERFAEQLGQRWRPISLPDGYDLNALGRRQDGRVEFFRLLSEARKDSAREHGHGS